MTEKGSAAEPRYALRSSSLKELDVYIQDQKIAHTPNLGRWKVTGVHPSIGVHGALAFLVQQSWTDPEVLLYLSKDQLVFRQLQVAIVKACIGLCKELLVS